MVVFLSTSIVSLSFVQTHLRERKELGGVMLPSSLWLRYVCFSSQSSRGAVRRAGCEQAVLSRPEAGAPRLAGRRYRAGYGHHRSPFPTPGVSSPARSSHSPGVRFLQGWFGSPVGEVLS